MVESGMTKVFGIGLSRTGSTSLTEALSSLGYRSIHFPANPITQREYSDFFDNPSGTLKLSLLDHYDAITDTPLPQVYRELDRGYPGSKFIWTIRDKESWLKSCELWWRRSVIPFMENDHLEKLRPFMRLVGRVTYGTAGFDAELFSQAYDAHMEEVPRYFLGRNRDLLPLNICAGNGWLELAPFLGMAVPDLPFPHRNEMIPDAGCYG
jgi:Sulfotransferase domain